MKLHELSSDTCCCLQWAPTMECADQLYADADANVGQNQPAEFGKTELSLMHFTVCVVLACGAVAFMR